MRHGATRLYSFISLLLTAALMATSGAVLAQAPSGEYQEGVHYSLIPDAAVHDGGPIEVVEAFSYLCNHCATFEPYIDSWKERKPDNVEFKRIPAVFGRSSWELYARAYATAEMMGIADEAHSAMMDKLWKEREVMRDMEALAEFYGGFDTTTPEFLAMSKSFAVDARMRRDQRVLQNAGVRGTPSMIVNGKYLVAGNAAVGNYDVLLDVVNYLVAVESAALANAGEASEDEIETGTSGAASATGD